MKKTGKEQFNLNIHERGIENKGYDKNDDNSPPKYLWDRKIFSLIWLSYCVSFPKLYTGKETYLSNLATRAVNDTFENKKIKRLIGEWELLWGVSVEQRPTSNVADGTMFVAKYKPYSAQGKKNYAYNSGFNEEDDNTERTDNSGLKEEDDNTERTERTERKKRKERTERYVISIAGTNPFSIFAAVFQDLSIFKTRSWNKGEPWSKDIRDKTSKSDRPAISSGASRGLKVHLTKMQGSRGKLLLDFLKKEIKDLVEKKKQDIKDQIERAVKELENDLKKKAKSIYEETISEPSERTQTEENQKEEIEKTIKAIQDFLKKKNADDLFDLDDRKLGKIIKGYSSEGSLDEELIEIIKKEIKGLKPKIKELLKVEITVAGHSLGGALAQIIALALKERQKDWDKYELCTIKVVSVGNPCFTNDKFVDRYKDKDNKLDKETYRFWCDIDMVPYLTNNTRRLATIYEPDISSNILIDTLTDILRQSIKQNKYKHISNQPAAFNGYKGKFNKKFAIQYINDNEDIKDYISSQTTSLIFLVLFQQLQVALFVPNFIGDVVEDTFKGIAREYSEAFAKILAQVLDGTGEVNIEFDNLLSRFFDAFSGIPGIGPFAQFNANLLDSNNVVELMNWSVQFAYQHVNQYEKYLKIEEFTKEMREITKKSEKNMKYSSNSRLE